MNMLEKILNYIYAPLIRTVNKNNQQPTVSIEDRSFFQIFLVFTSSVPITMLVLVRLFVVSLIYMKISFTFTMEISIIPLLVIVMNLYFSFGFAYYFHITFKNYMKFVGRQILDLILTSIAAIVIVALGLFIIETNFNFIARDILLLAKSIVGCFLLCSGVLFGAYRFIMIFIYHPYVTYSKYYLNKYNDENQ